MRKLLAIITTDLRLYLSEIGNLVGLLVVPIGLTVLLGFLGGGGGANNGGGIRVDVVDNDQSALSQQLLNTMQATNERLILCPMAAADDTANCQLDDSTLTVEQGQERVREGTTRSLLVIPQGYAQQLQAAEPVTIDYYTLADVTSGADPVRVALDAAVQRANSTSIAAEVAVNVAQDVSANTFSDAAERQQFQAAVREQASTLLASNPAQVDFVLAQAGAQDDNSGITQGFGQSVPGQGSMFVMFTIFGAMSLLIRERQQWTLQRLVTMPLTRTQILAGKIGTYFTLGIIQYAVVFAVGVIVGLDFGDAPLALLLIALSFVLAITGITLALATRIRSEGQASSLATLLALTLAPLGGAWWPLEITPEFMQVIGHLSPVAWAMDGFTEIIFFGGGLVDVLPFIGVLLAIAAVSFGIGIVGFRYEP